MGLFAFVVLFEGVEGTHPPLLDDLVITGELPGDQLFRVLRSEIVVLVDECLPDVLPLHHILRFELDGEVGRSGFEAIDFDDVDDFDRALRQFVEMLEHLDVIAYIEQVVPVKDLGMLEQ